MDYGSYIEVLGSLKDLRYPFVDSLWLYDAMDIIEMPLLKNDLGTTKMKNIELMIKSVYLYVIHQLLQPEIIEESHSYLNIILYDPM